MELKLSDAFVATDQGREAGTILQKCVHCGFCTATCPTYQLLGDELDGPRGRIYLIKSILEGYAFSETTRIHLDRCLTCRACESTCPSGVQYGRLLEIGRELVEEKLTRPALERLVRFALGKFLSSKRFFGSRVFSSFLFVGQLFRPMLPPSLTRYIPRRRNIGHVVKTPHSRRMLVLDGCVQSGFAPIINAAASRALDQAGILLISVPRSGCCGALSLHLTQTEEAKNFMRKNIDAWWPEIESGCEAIVMTSSGCGVMVLEYGRLLSNDPVYGEKAAKVSALTRDLSEIIKAEMPRDLTNGNARRVSYHSPCTLQHGQKINGLVEEILVSYGWQLAPVRDGHLCCGSAGTYSVLQGKIGGQLRERKLAALQEGKPEMIASANIGCLLYLGAHATVPVRHWIELLDPEFEAT